MINVIEIPSLAISTNGFYWECQHLNVSKEYVTVNYDDSELVTICDACDAQLIGEEWINE